MELTEREKTALELRNKGLTYEKIGEQLGGISKTRTSQIISQAERKLRRISHISIEDDFWMLISREVPNSKAATMIKKSLIIQGITTVDGIKNFSADEFSKLHGMGRICTEYYRKILDGVMT